MFKHTTQIPITGPSSLLVFPRYYVKVIIDPKVTLCMVCLVSDRCNVNHGFVLFISQSWCVLYNRFCEDLCGFHSPTFSLICTVRKRYCPSKAISEFIGGGWGRGGSSRYFNQFCKAIL